MIQFLKRYQRSIFFVITVLIIFSIVFYGVRPALDHKPQDPIAFQTFNKQKVKRSELHNMTALLSTHEGNHIFFKEDLGVHFFGDSLIQKEFIQSGLLEALFDKYEETLQDEVLVRWNKEKEYTPYVHPYGSYVNAINLWVRFAPSLHESFDKYKQASTAKEAFLAKLNLFNQERDFPPYLLWQHLRAQESKFSSLPKDPQLVPKKLSLFHYQSYEDWLGSSLIEKMAAFIFHTAALAEKNGYKVTQEEVLRDIVSRNEYAYHQLKEVGDLPFESSAQFLQLKLSAMGISQEQILSLWSKVLLFKKYFNEAASSLFLDPLTFESFENYAHQSVEAEVYRLPQDLQFHDFRMLELFEVYLRAVTGKKLNRYEIPEKTLALEEIDKRVPELIETPFEIQYKEVDRASVGLKISLREIQKWELDPHNLPLLVKHFPSLGFKESLSQSMIFDVIEALNPKDRQKVDHFAKHAILDKQTDWTEKSLEEKEILTLEVDLRKKGGKLPFKGIERSPQREAFIEKLFQEEAPPLISFNDEHYYQVVSSQKKGDKKLVSFKTALADQTLTDLFFKELKDRYEILKKKNPEALQDKEGKIKPFSEMKDSLEEELFKPLKGAIQKEAQRLQKPLPEWQNDGVLAGYRLLGFFENLKGRVIEGESSLSLLGLFDIQKNVEKISRAKETDLDAENFLSMKEGAWTEVKPTPMGGLYFAKILQKIEEKNENHSIVFDVKSVFEKDLKTHYAKKILSQI